MLTKLKSLFKSLTGKVLFAVVFVVAFWLVKEGKQTLVKENAMNTASTQAGEAVEREIKTAQAQATQEKSTTDVLAENSKKKLSATLDVTNTDKKKVVVASNTFFGAYFLNTRTRPA